MALTEAQKRAKAKYTNEKVKRLTVSFYPAEAELWDKLQAQENKQGYIKDLIRKDIFGEIPVDYVQQVHEERLKALEQVNYLQGKHNKKDLK